MNHMKTIKIFFIYLTILLKTITLTAMMDDEYPLKGNLTELPIVVVVCSYNNSQWSENTLNSIFTQKYKNFRVIIVDDCSTDNNREVIQGYIDKHNLAKQVTFICNEQRHRKLFNLYRVLYDCKDDEIVIMVDGDDSLENPEVFSFYNAIYQDENIWFTYGQYKNVPASQAIHWGHKEMGYCRPVPKHIQRKIAYRYYSFIYMHPRTFRAWLFKLVKLQDLIADNIVGFEGDFYPASNDVAMYFPMVEMAHTHIKFIPDILYIRNLFSEIVGFKVDRRIQTASAREIRKKSCYPVLFQPKKNRLEPFKHACADLFLLCRQNLINIEATLENIQKNSLNLGTIYVFFHNTEENKKICRFIKKNFSKVIFVPYDADGSKSLKNRMLSYLALCKNDHVCLMSDSCSIIKTLNFSRYIFWLEKTYAHRFYLNRTASQASAPHSIPLSHEICAWKLPEGPNIWKDNDPGKEVVLCQTTALYQEIKNLRFTNTYSLLRALESYFLPTRVGLFLSTEHINSIA